ncbi:AlpA family transcriptional regulator [Cupriavidus sp. UYPR2.512]|uniref:helix-turn-helix transcriptional regulator n=1 Tax=Cupriavidus sp. UYPR2.512 TaxID=1080187 RepID=UPI0003825ABC|nr:AlpA family phage regulatory protein [Cupriavidus necator]
MTDPQIRRTIRREELRQIVPLSDSTVYEMEAKGKFPKRFALTPRCVVWYLDEVLQWVEARRTGEVAVQAVTPPKPKRKRALEAMPA